MKIIVADRDGAEQAIDAVEGWRVMEIIRAHGFGLEAECGGAAVCGTCQVHVDPAWAGKLHEPREDELERLDENFAEPDERLSCQLIFTEELDGLRLILPDYVKLPELA
ncbi:2Fe-2S iron-sulfur cluster-binding protein [Tepidicaulis sp. LMO-SS28]|uniref:2Fe-2S iron-sulfur cluster-binding protein n=1 Tax=Tepidicaulis sp. LMO-SS28 TaxID=3447455 RepID=UPI003EDFD500